MQTFFCKLLTPRPTFAQDMSAAEADLMREHAAYWREWMGQGKVVVFGPVADPAAAFGIAILEVSDKGELARLTSNDPVIRAARGFQYEIHPMPLGAVHPRCAPAELRILSNGKPPEGVP